MSGAAKAIISVLVLAIGVAIVLILKNSNQESPMSQAAPANQKYDDASWHYDGDFPEGLPPEAGATHMGMFAAWVMLNGMASEEFAEDVEVLRSPKITPGEFIMEQCDEKMFSEMFNEKGNRFATAYYADDNAAFGRDYEAELAANLPSIYHVKDTWETYEKVKPIFDRRLAEFRKSAKAEAKPWWKFW